jgi:hypothetical protein
MNPPDTTALILIAADLYKVLGAVQVEGDKAILPTPPEQVIKLRVRLASALGMNP